MSLEDKRIVVIGGGSGMGLAVAHAAAAQDAEVIISGRNVQKLEEAASGISGRVQVAQLDLTDEDSVAQMFERVDTLDHLVVTGASGSPGEFLSQPVTEAQYFMDSKFWGAFRAARYAAPRLREKGSITFNSGGFAVTPTAGAALVTASLAALEMLGKSLALELAPIRVNSVRPGTIETPLWNEMPESDRRKLFEEAANRAPVGRVGQPEDVALAVLFLINHEYITGTVLDVNGGETLT
ncbi:MAG: SDR family oxidoreductase [Rubrobacteraceae bacterium]